MFLTILDLLLAILYAFRVLCLLNCVLVYLIYIGASLTLFSIYTKIGYLKPIRIYKVGLVAGMGELMSGVIRRLMV